MSVLGDTPFATDIATTADLTAGLAGKAAAVHAHAGEDVTFGTVADARIASTIARDSEVTAAVATEASDRATADALLVAKAIVDAKGDLIAASAADTVARLPVGSNDQVLTADSAQTLGVKWAAAAASGAPTTATYITQTADAGLNAEQALSALATGLVKNTTGTGVLSIGAEGTDYWKPGGTDVALADGGTGASTAAAARTNLGLVIDTDVASITTANAKVPKSLYDANTVLAADTDDTPAAVTMGASTILARLASGNIKAASVAELRTLLLLDENLDLAWTFDPANIHAVATIPDGTNRCVYVRVARGGTFSKLGIAVGTASGNISVAAYTNSGAGTSARPGTQVATSGAVACPASGFREISVGATVTVKTGDWFALSADNTTATFWRALGSGGVMFPWRSGKQATAHPCPSPAGTLVADDRPFLIVGIP